MIADGWDGYARTWSPGKHPVAAGHGVEFLGDEWSGQPHADGGMDYGLPAEVTARFGDYLRERLVEPYIAADSVGMEIGPGGGRFTALLLPRVRTLHLAEPSKAMIGRLRSRFPGQAALAFHHTDGRTLPPLPGGSLDFCVAFDVFVHFEPRLVFWYLRQIRALLRPGGTAIIHYANVTTPAGLRQFLCEVEGNLDRRRDYSAFGVMSPDLMAALAAASGFEPVSLDLGLMPRDAVAILAAGPRA
jgi:SAM-dependent methyltransferase